MGSIYWQLNDCWPVASWSSIDYYGRWKALQYYARRFYAPILVSPHVEDGAVKVYVVSDKTAATSAELRVRLMDFDGKVLLEEKHDISVDPLASKVYLDWPLAKIAQAGASDTSRVFVVAELLGSDGSVSRNLIYLAPTKEVHLRPTVLQTNLSRSDLKTKGKNTYTIKITSPVLARDVYLSFGATEVDVSDNYFDMLPGETIEITANTNASIDELKAQMKIVSLVDAFGTAIQPATVGAAR
jgi:beta-mannosidase